MSKYPTSGPGICLLSVLQAMPIFVCLFERECISTWWKCQRQKKSCKNQF
jgi:hypothetical protein